MIQVEKQNTTTEMDLNDFQKALKPIKVRTSSVQKTHTKNNF